MSINAVVLIENAAHLVPPLFVQSLLRLCALYLNSLMKSLPLNLAVLLLAKQTTRQLLDKQKLM